MAFIRPDLNRKKMKTEPNLFIIKSKDSMDPENSEAYVFAYFPGNEFDLKHDPREMELGDYDDSWIYFFKNPKDASAFTYGGAMCAYMWIDEAERDQYHIVPRRDYVAKFVEPSKRAPWNQPKKKEAKPAFNPFKTKPKAEVETAPKVNPFKTKPSPAPAKPVNPFLKK